MKKTKNWSRMRLDTQINRQQLDFVVEIYWLRVISLILLFSTGLLVQPAFAQDSVQRPNEMEFDARVIQGQRAEGAVYLFQRATRSLPPLLKYKRDYLTAIVSPIFSQESALGQKLKAKSKKGHLEIGKQTKVTKTTKPTGHTSSTRSRKNKKNTRKTWRKSRRKSKSKSMRRGRK